MFLIVLRYAQFQNCILHTSEFVFAREGFWRAVEGAPKYEFLFFCVLEWVGPQKVIQSAFLVLCSKGVSLVRTEGDLEC